MTSAAAHTTTPTHPDERRLAEATPHRAAVFVSRIGQPLHVATALLLGSAWYISGITHGTKWAALALLFCVALPYAGLKVLVHRGLATDTQVVRREQRHLPHLIALLSVSVGLGILAFLGAPGTLIAVLLSIITCLMSTATFSVVEKVSIHVCVITHTVALFAVLVTPWLLFVAVPACGVMAWARVNEGRHTRTQVVFGAMIGAFNGALVFFGFSNLLG